MPKSPGVYLFKDARGKTIYVGKAKSLRARVSSYFVAVDKLLPKTAEMVASAKELGHIKTESEIDALILEANLIRKLSPKYNVNWKDGKSYPLIKITLKDSVPIIKKVHHEEGGGLYFGPYPTGTDLAGLLRFLRKIFPYVSENHPGNRPCLRSHLGLCPCPDVFLDETARKRYRSDIHNLIDFLLGKRQIVQKRLIKQMELTAKQQRYEQANEIKKKLTQIEYLTSPRRNPWEYESNPNLVSDQIETALSELCKTLKITSAEKIECYDIANISGKSASGGQVVFVDGIAEKSLYRRYKIKLNPPVGKQNDYAMLQEMIKRRLKSKIPLPDLMVIDGGKGQLTAVMAVIRDDLPTSPKIIALAKKLETIYTNTGEQLNLAKNSPALQLLQKVRDEAHRFSRRYHFWLRSKNMLT